MSTNLQNSVGAYQILLTTNPFLLNDLRGVAKTAKEFLSESRFKHHTHIFTSEDSGFLELRHEFKSGNSRSNKGPFISLKTYDPGIPFLTDLYFDFLNNSVSRIDDEKELEQTQLKGFYEELAEVEKRIDTLPFDIGITEEVIKEIKRSGDTRFLNKEVKILEEQKAELGSNIEREDELVREIQNIISQRTLPKVYLMYGIGNDLTHWSDPMETYLGEIIHSNDGMRETTEYIFSVDVITEQFLDDDVASPDKDDTKTSFYDSVGVPLMAFNYSTSLARHISQVPFKNSPRNFHDAILHLISNYLFTLGIKNHLLVFPDINSILQPQIAAAFQRYLQGSELFSKKLRSMGIFKKEDLDERIRSGNWILNLPWDNTGVAKSANQSQYYTFLQQLFSEGEATSLGGDPALEGARPDAVAWARTVNEIYGLGNSLIADVDRSWFGTGKKRLAEEYTNLRIYVIQSVLQSIGLKTVKSSSRSSDVDPAIGVTITEDEDKLISCSNPFYLQANTITSKLMPGTISANKIVRLNFDEAEDQDKPQRDWSKPIREIAEGLNVGTGGDIIRWWDGYITDTWLKETVLKKFSPLTFGGYASVWVSKLAPAGTTAPPLVADDTPLYVCGDRDLIRLLLFGEFHHRIKTDDRLKDIEFLVEKGDFPFANMNANPPIEVKDLFWNAIKDDILNITKGSPNYFTEIYNILNPTSNSTNLGFYGGSFSDKEGIRSILPDEFGYVFDDNTLQDIFDENLPMFLSNTNQANVLSYSFDVNKFIYGSFFGSMREVYYNVSRRYLRDSNPIFSPDMTQDEIQEKIKEIIENLRSKSGFMGAGLSKSSGVGTPTDPEQLYDDLAKVLFLESKLSPSMSVRRGRASSVVSFVLLFLDIYEKQYIGTIKTLPFFNLSNAHTLNRSALTVLKSATKIAPTPGLFGNPERREPIANYLSGMYKILGFQHVITSSDAYSEFTVVKDIISEINNEI